MDVARAGQGEQAKAAELFEKHVARADEGIVRSVCQWQFDSRPRQTITSMGSQSRCLVEAACCNESEFCDGAAREACMRVLVCKVRTE